LKAVHEAMDLGQLFLGLSIFLIAGVASLLTAMAFVFTAEQRAKDGHPAGQRLHAGPGPAPSSWRKGAVLACWLALASVGSDFARFP